MSVGWQKLHDGLLERPYMGSERSGALLPGKQGCELNSCTMWHSTHASKRLDRSASGCPRHSKAPKSIKGDQPSESPCMP